MSILSRLKGEGVLLLHHDYRNGSYQDLSGNSKHGTPTVAYLSKEGARFATSTGADIDVGADTLGTGAGSVMVFCRPDGAGESNAGRLFDNNAFDMYTNASDQVSYGFGTTRTGSVGGIARGADHVVIASWDASGTANLYVDGSLDDGPGAIGSPGAGTSMIVGNDTAGAKQFKGAILAVALVNRELTPSEVTELTAEITRSSPDTRHVISTPSKGLQTLGNGARETTSNLSAGQQVPGTPFYINSGTWSIGVETVDGKSCKVLTCVADGIAYADWGDLRNNDSEAAYGSWEFWFNKDGGSNPSIVYNGREILSRSSAGQYGYFMLMTSVERYRIYRIDDGSAVFLIGTAASAVSSGSWQKHLITRDSLGSTTCYVDDTKVVIEAGAGNPFTENTYMTAEYFLLELDAGDKLALSTLSGEPMFKKYYGVM